MSTATSLAVLSSRYDPVSFEAGLARANAENKVIASNKRISRALLGSDEWRAIQEVFVCWTGTMTAYTKPGEKLGKAVEYADPETGYRWIFPVPEKHQGKTNAILVAEHPDYTLEISGKTRIVRATQVDLIERFPAKNGWYLGDTHHDIPCGDEVAASDATRYLLRTDIRVGPVARGRDSDGIDVGRQISLRTNPSGAFGMAVEVRAPRKS